MAEQRYQAVLAVVAEGKTVTEVAGNGVVCVGWQQVCVGKNYSGSRCDVLVTGGVLQFWVGNQLLKTVARTSSGEIRNKRAHGTGRQRGGWLGGVAHQPE